MKKWAAGAGFLLVLCFFFFRFSFSFSYFFFFLVLTTAEVVPESERMNVATTQQTAALFQCIPPHTADD